MSVAITTKDWNFPSEVEKGRRRCTMCDENLQPPFLHWDSLFLCSKCCLKLRRDTAGLDNVFEPGLAADLVHVAAIMELHALGYNHETLQRRFVTAVERENERRIEKDRAIETEWERLNGASASEEGNVREQPRPRLMKK